MDPVQQYQGQGSKPSVWDWQAPSLCHSTPKHFQYWQHQKMNSTYVPIPGCQSPHAHPRLLTYCSRCSQRYVFALSPSSVGSEHPQYLPKAAEDTSSMWVISNCFATLVNGLKYAVVWLSQRILPLAELKFSQASVRQSPWSSSRRIQLFLFLLMVLFI